MEAPDREPPRQMGHRSVSQVTTFAKCGEAYRLEKVEKAPGLPAAWFAQGTAFHEAVEAWERSGRELSTVQATDIYEESWWREITEMEERAPIARWLTGGRTKPDKDIENRHAKGKGQVEAYIARALKAPERILDLGEGEYACELEFSLNLGGVKVIGAIDQVVIYPDGGIRVRDLKTGTKQPDWNFQLGVYALALRDNYGIPCEWGDFYMAKNSEPLPPVFLEKFTEEFVTRMFVNMDRAERLGLYLPNPGDGCRVCGVAEFCEVVGARAPEYASRQYDNREATVAV